MKRIFLPLLVLVFPVLARADLRNPTSITAFNVVSGTSTLINFSTATISCSSCGIMGVTDGSTANAGIYGEYISSATSGVSFQGTTGQWGNSASITLTPGDWDISGMCDYQGGSATVTRAICCVGGTVSGNSGTGCSISSNQGDTALPNAAVDGGFGIGGVRESITTTTTFYLKNLLSFSVATPTVNGRISARRVR